MFNVTDPTVGIHVFRVRRNGSLVTAVYYNSNKTLTEPNRAEAQKELDAEFALWANSTRLVGDDKK